MGGSNKAQTTPHGGGGSAPPTLVKALLKEAAFLRNLVEMTSVPQTFLLLMTCKELLAAEKDVFEKHKLPVVCKMGRGCNEFKLFRAMVGTPNSRWVKWLNTSEVEELNLPRSVTDEEMLILFDAAGGLSFDGGGGGGGGGEEGGKRFSELQELDLGMCSNITDASVLEVARRCSNLQCLEVYNCENITDASLMEVARQCSKIHTLNLDSCSNITDASMLEVARRCSNLSQLILSGCSNITSACKNALRQLARDYEIYNEPYRFELVMDSSSSEDSNEEDY